MMESGIRGTLWQLVVVGVFCGVLVILLAEKGYGGEVTQFVWLTLLGALVLELVSWSVIATFLCPKEMRGRGEARMWRALMPRPKLFWAHDTLTWLYPTVMVLIGIRTGRFVDLVMLIGLIIGIMAVEQAAEAGVELIFPAKAKKAGE
jgi:hypothetical protein